MRFRFLFLVYAWGIVAVYGQGPGAQFLMPANACLGQNLFLQNQSSPALRYEWDFCQGDLSVAPTATAITTLGGSVVTGIDVVYDGTNWYGFAVSEYTNSIFRLDFGSDPGSTPSVVNLGNVGGLLDKPVDIKVISENGNWFGFVYGSNAPLMSRINFGVSLSNTSQLTIDTVLPGSGYVNGGFDMIYDGIHWVMVITSNSSLMVVRLPALNGTPAPADIISNIPDSFSSSMGDVVLQKANGNYFGYVVSYGNHTLQSLSFGASVFSTPVIHDLATVMPSGYNPYGIDAGMDNGQYFLFISTLEGNLLKINLGSDLTTAPVSGTALGNLGLLSNNIRIRMIKNQSEWYGYTPNYNSTVLYGIRFPNPCGVSPAFTTVTNPQISYSASGQKWVGLRAYTSQTDFTERNKALIVTGSPAPDVEFSYTIGCAGMSTGYTAVNLSGNLNAYTWDFGDSQGAGTADASHTYSAAGVYTVGLNVGASNGCFNETRKTVTVFNPPVAEFLVPNPAAVCTNQSYTFLNQSSVDAGSNPSWQWSVNGTPIATTPNFMETFSAISTNQIKLAVAIPGCTTQRQQTFVVQQTGPVVDFTLTYGCQGTGLPFVNTTVGSGLTFTWNFGDGNSSSTPSPQHTYTSYGIFPVTLVAAGPNGCQNSNAHSVTIYSTPLTDFTLSLPPFSCSGSPSQFNDATPSPTDSNLSKWSWNFGDLVNDTSSQQNPTHTYALAGPYTVGLTVTSNFGCVGSIQKPVAITASPAASFSHAAACVNQGTSFNDTTPGTIKSWLWQMGTNTYKIQKPVNVFGADGSYTVQLTVTDASGCVGQTSQQVVVPVPRVPDFSVTSTCATKPASFQDTTPSGPDALMTYTWNFGGLGTGTGSSAQFAFPSIGNYSVRLDGHAQSGCVYSVTKSVAIVAPPVAGFTASPEAGAAPLFVQFANTSTGANTLLWHFHDPANTTSQDPAPAFTFNALGDYVVDLDALNGAGCTDTYSKIIHAVVPNADAGLSNLQLIRDPATGQLQVLFVIDNHGNLPLVNPSVEVSISGNTTLKENLNLVVAPGKTASQLLTFSLMPSSVQYLCMTVEAGGDSNPANDKQCASADQGALVLSPYPNPVRSELHLDWIATGEGPARVTIFNSSGATAFDQQISSLQSGLNQLRVDVSQFSPGVYLVELVSPGFTKTFRFVVH